jgi:hypothetical protein
MFENNGQTTALNSMGHVGLTMQPIGDPPPIFDAANYRGVHPIPISKDETISQSQDFVEPLMKTSPRISLDVLRSLLSNGSHRLYVYGGMNYRDIFDEFHWRRYCYYLERDLKSWHSCEGPGNAEDAAQTVR